MSLLAGTRLAAIDTETTGFDPAQGHALIELACVTLDDGEIVDDIAPGTYAVALPSRREAAHV